MARKIDQSAAEFPVREKDLEDLGSIERDEDAIYTIRPFTRPALERIHRKNTSTKRGAEHTDQIGVTRDQIDYVIVGWSGVVGGDDEAIECDRAAKLALHPTIATALVQLAMDGQRAAEDALRRTF